MLVSWLWSTVCSACDKQKWDAFQPSRFTGVRPSAVIALQTVWWETWGRSRSRNIDIHIGITVKDSLARIRPKRSLSNQRCQTDTADIGCWRIEFHWRLYEIVDNADRLLWCAQDFFSTPRLFLKNKTYRAALKCFNVLMSLTIFVKVYVIRCDSMQCMLLDATRW